MLLSVDNNIIIRICINIVFTIPLKTKKIHIKINFNEFYDKKNGVQMHAISDNLLLFIF